MKASSSSTVLEREETWEFRLYIAGMSRVARRALANLEEICETHLAGRHHLRVVDLLKEPQRAEQDQIIAVPTLVRESPGPPRKLIGDLSSRARVLQHLEIQLEVASAPIDE